MLKEVLDASASVVGEVKQKDFHLLSSPAQDIVSAIKAGNGGDYCLQKDKSGEMILCHNTKERITPLVCISTEGVAKPAGNIENDFHKHLALYDTLSDIRNRLQSSDIVYNAPRLAAPTPA